MMLHLSEIYNLEGKILICFLVFSWEERNLENTRPQSQEWPLVPHVLMWALKSDWTAYPLEHFSQTYCFWLLCFLLKCFLMPTRSPRAWHGSWCKQLGSGQTNTFFFTTCVSLFSNFHGTLCLLLCIWRFWSLWNPWLQISQTYLSDSSKVFGERDTTSASGSVCIRRKKKTKKKKKKKDKWIFITQNFFPRKVWNI